MITRLSLRNFKCWQELTLELKDITLLFGANSSGKSSVLKSLLMLKQTASNFGREPIYFGGEERDFVDLGSYRDVVTRQDESQRIQLDLAWKLDQPIDFGNDYHNIELVDYKVTWRKLKTKVVVERLDYGIVPSSLFFKATRKDEGSYKYNVPKGLKDTSGANPQPSSLDSCYGIPIEVANRYSTVDFLEFNRQFEKLMNRIYYLGPLRNPPKRDYLWTGSAPREISMKGDNTIESLIASQRQVTTSKGTRRNKKNTLIDQVQHWLKKLELLDQFEIKAIDEDNRHYQTQLRMNTSERTHSLVDVGFGVSQVLPVIALLFFVPEGSIVLIEQPELHLHPIAQKNLADLFIEVAEKRHLQLVVETHSEHLLRRLQRRIAEVEHPYPTPETVSAYFFKRGEENAIAEPVEIDLFGDIRNWPEEFFGDISADIQAAREASIKRRREQLSNEQ